MRRDELLKEVGYDDNDNPFAIVDMDLLRELIKAPLQDDDDIETAITITRLVFEEFQALAQDQWPMLDNSGIESMQRCWRNVLTRQSIEFDLPWRNFYDAKREWSNLEGSARLQKQQRLIRLDEIFDQPLKALYKKQDLRDIAELARPVSSPKNTGWKAVDEAIESVRKAFISAQSTSDYKAVGLHCVTTLERLSEAVYDEEKHVGAGVEPIPKEKRKNRMEAYISYSLQGKDVENLRALVRAADRFAETVKHRESPTRRDAGVAADAVILTSRLLRWIDPEYRDQ